MQSETSSDEEKVFNRSPAAPVELSTGEESDSDGETEDVESMSEGGEDLNIVLKTQSTASPGTIPASSPAPNQNDFIVPRKRIRASPMASPIQHVIPLRNRFDGIEDSSCDDTTAPAPKIPKHILSLPSITKPGHHQHVGSRAAKTTATTTASTARVTTSSTSKRNSASLNSGATKYGKGAPHLREGRHQLTIVSGKN